MPSTNVFSLNISVATLGKGALALNLSRSDPHKSYKTDVRKYFIQVKSWITSQRISAIAFLIQWLLPDIKVWHCNRIAHLGVEEPGVSQFGYLGPWSICLNETTLSLSVAAWLGHKASGSLECCLAYIVNYFLDIFDVTLFGRTQILLSEFASLPVYRILF